MMEVWPAHRYETLPWRQSIRGGTREDRMLSAVDTAIPPFIATLSYAPTPALATACEQAVGAVSAADAVSEGQSAALSRFMICTESVASSKIERISASSEDLARAIAGHRSNASATSMVAASTALHELVTSVGEHGTFRVDDLLVAHRRLMVDDPHEADHAGRIRDMQNWIGGSDHSPRDALYVPPPPGRLEALLEDLVAYLNRDDLPVIVQAAIAHAQFESIHPFTDGNGRIGRAIVAAVLRRRGLMTHSVVPLTSGLLARREEYFDSLDLYRRGEPDAVIALFARSARIAAREARTTIDRITSLPEEWRSLVRARAGSALTELLTAFYDHPVMSTASVEKFSGVGVSQSYASIDRLVEAGILREITGRKRDRVWVASDLLAELDDLDRRIQAAMR